MYEMKYQQNQERNIKITTYEEMNDKDSCYLDSCVRCFINRDIIFPAFCDKKTKKKLYLNRDMIKNNLSIQFF